MHCEAMVGFRDRGSLVFDYGNGLRREALLGGGSPGHSNTRASSQNTSGRSSARERGPFRWVALSGDPADIAATDRAVLDEFPGNEQMARRIELASERVSFQGLPARICWLGYGERATRSEIQRDGASWRSRRADRHRTRPPRLGFGCFALRYPFYTSTDS